MSEREGPRIALCSYCGKQFIAAYSGDAFCGACTSNVSSFGPRTVIPIKEREQQHGYCSIHRMSYIGSSCPVCAKDMGEK